MRRTICALAAVTALVLAVPACGDDDTTATVTDDSSPQPSSAGGDATTTSVADSTTTVAAEPLVLTATGVGELQIGMTIEAASATGLVGEFTPGCELASPDATGAPLLAPLKGYVYGSGGSLTHIDVRGGAVTDPGGVAIGDHVDAATQAFEDAGYTVELDKSLEDMFGEWFLRVVDGGATVFESFVTPATGRLTSLSVPSVVLCE